MKQLNCVIIDDDRAAISVLLHHVNRVNFLNVLGHFTSPIEALDKMTHLDVDLVFLDIEMNGLTGTELIRLLDPNLKVVFCTGHARYAVESYEVNAIDYLLKPITLNRFLQAMRRVKSAFNMPELGVTVEFEDLFFLVNRGGKFKNFKIDFCDIDYIKAKRNGCRIYFPEKEPLETNDSLAKLYSHLPKDKFLQVNKGCVISLSRYLNFEGGFVYLTGKQTSMITVGSAYRASLLKWINQYQVS